MLGRISTVTLTTPDLRTSTAAYQRYLGYRITDDGAVGRDTARSWGRSALASARAVLMEPESGADTYLRFVEGPAYVEFEPFTCLGWNAAALIVEDVDRLADELRGGPFRIIGPPGIHSSSDQGRAMQVVGPAREVLTLTQVPSKRSAGGPPDAACFVDRVFMVILGGGSLDALQDYYHSQHGLARVPETSSVMPAMSNVYGLPADHQHAIATLQVPGQCYIEVDRMPEQARPRPCLPGQLPPGLSMVSFEVDRLPPALPGSLGEAHRSAPLPYSGRRACTCVGAVGELIELIEST